MSMVTQLVGKQQGQILPFFLLLIPMLYYVVKDGGGGRETPFCLEWPLLLSVHLYCSYSRFSFLWKLFQSILQNSDCFIIIHYPYIVLSVIFSLKTYGPKLYTNYLIPGTTFYNFPLCSPIISPHTVPVYQLFSGIVFINENQIIITSSKKNIAYHFLILYSGFHTFNFSFDPHTIL